MKTVYVNSAVSICDGTDFNRYIKPIEARRMNLLMKKAVAASMDALAEAGIGMTDDIITGTGLGCVESTEQFLLGLCGIEGHDMKPTHFMQSTHNTIGSLIAIRLRNHGYNTTYTQRGISFESALLDGLTRIRTGDSRSALIGSFDAMTDYYSNTLKSAGMSDVFHEQAVSCVISDSPVNALCKISSVSILFRPSPDKLEYTGEIDEILTGSALGFMEAAHKIAKGKARRILIKSVSDNTEYGLTLLEKL